MKICPLGDQLIAIPIQILYLPQLLLNLKKFKNNKEFNNNNYNTTFNNSKIRKNNCPIRNYNSFNNNKIIRQKSVEIGDRMVEYVNTVKNVDMPTEKKIWIKNLMLMNILKPESVSYSIRKVTALTVLDVILFMSIKIWKMSREKANWQEKLV